MKPKCPKCGSTNVVASLAKNSHDNCVNCGYSDFVVFFYESVDDGPIHAPTGRKKGARPAEPEPVQAPVRRAAPEANAPSAKTEPKTKYWWED